MMAVQYRIRYSARVVSIFFPQMPLVKCVVLVSCFSGNIWVVNSVNKMYFNCEAKLYSNFLQLQLHNHIYNMLSVIPRLWWIVEHEDIIAETYFLERSEKMSRSMQQPILLWAAVMKQIIKTYWHFIIINNMLIHKI